MRKWKVTFYIGITVAILALLGIVIYVVKSRDSKATMDDVRQEAMIDESYDVNETVPYPESAYESIYVDPDSGEEVVTVVDPGLVCPVDFYTLWNTNSDIYAWLRIPGTTIDYPVLQHMGDTPGGEIYYLRRDLEGNYSTAGNLFSEYYYNHNFHEDNLTVIYGHNMRDKSMFGTLDLYLGGDNYISRHNYIYMYTPYNAYRYRVVGVLTRGDEHLLYKYSGLIDGQGDFSNFVADFNGGLLGEGWMEDGFVASDSDVFLVLSTCTRPNTGRFVVIAVRDEVRDNLLINP